MDSDDSLLHTRPICEGYARHPLAGHDLTEELVKILTEPEYSYTAAAERAIVRDVREKPCNIGLDCDTELETAELPDGHIVMRDRLIQPSFIGQRIPRLFFPFLL